MNRRGNLRRALIMLAIGSRLSKMRCNTLSGLSGPALAAKAQVAGRLNVHAHGYASHLNIETSRLKNSRDRLPVRHAWSPNVSQVGRGWVGLHEGPCMRPPPEVTIREIPNGRIRVDHGFPPLADFIRVKSRI